MTLSLPRQSIDCMNLSLRHLFIRSKFSILIGVLACVPNLKQLTCEDIYIHMGDNSKEFDLKLLADTLWKLDRLTDLHFTILHSAWNDHIPWRSFHPLFQSVAHQRNFTTLSGSITEGTIESH